MHETNRHSTCQIFMRLVSRRTSTCACPFLCLVQQRTVLCPVHTCFVGKRNGELACDSCLVRGTLDTSWYRGVVAATTNGVVSYGVCRKSCVWVSPALVMLDVSQRLPCCVGVVSSSYDAGRVSALVVLIVVVSSSWEAGRDSQHSLC